MQLPHNNYYFNCLCHKIRSTVLPRQPCLSKIIPRSTDCVISISAERLGGSNETNTVPSVRRISLSPRQFIPRPRLPAERTLFHEPRLARIRPSISSTISSTNRVSRLTRTQPSRNNARGVSVFAGKHRFPNRFERWIRAVDRGTNGGRELANELEGRSEG